MAHQITQLSNIFYYFELILIVQKKFLNLNMISAIKYEYPETYYHPTSP